MGAEEWRGQCAWSEGAKGGWLDEVREQGADKDVFIAVSQRDHTKHQKDCGPLPWFIASAAEPG